MEKTVDEFKNDGLLAFGYQCDVGKRDEINKLFEYVNTDFGRIDVLVNNAGVTQSAPLTEYPDEVWWQTLSVDLYAPFALCRVFSPLMAKVGGGSIINICSLASFYGFPNNPCYVASKGGLKQLSKALALDLSKKKIRVNNIIPGYIKTPMTIKSFKNNNRNKFIKDRIILNRWGNTEDLVGPIIFLSSLSSSYITGADIFVDGGWNAKGL